MGIFTSWQLKAGSAETRRRAAEKLGAPGKVANVDSLIGLLEDPDPGVRAAALDALGAIGDPKAIEAIARVVRDGVGSRDEAAIAVRISAVRALGRLGTGSIPALSEAVRDRNPKIREAVVEALAVAGGQGAVKALAIALTDDRLTVRQAAARALGSIGGEEAEGALAGALEHRDAATRAVAAEMLGHAGSARTSGALARALGDRDKNVRESAVAALGRIADAGAVEALIAAFEGRDRDLRQAAAAVLRAATWTPADARQRAVRAVIAGDIAAAQAEGLAAVGPLVMALADRDPVARHAAAEALGAIGGTDGVRPLVAALADHDEQVRGAAARALVNIGPSSAVAVIEALAEKSGPVRAAAAGILAAIGESRAVAPLVDAVTHYTFKDVITTRPIVVRGGNETAALAGDDDVLRVRGAVDTLAIMLTHAAGRLPVPDLERMAAFRDLVQAPHKSHGDPRFRDAAAEEVSCAELRRLATLELARRRHDS